MAQPRVDLTKFAWLSIAAALVTIGLKTAAWLITGSVGLLSDAAESVVNLVAAVVALPRGVTAFAAAVSAASERSVATTAVSARARRATARRRAPAPAAVP